MTIQEKDYDPALMQGAANSNTVPQTITDTSSSAFAVGRQGATNPVIAIDASTSSVVTGVKITGAATGTAVAVVATGSATDELLTINAKGAGTIGLGNISTGVVSIATASASGGMRYKASVLASSGNTTMTSAMSGSIMLLDGAGTDYLLPAIGAGDVGMVFTFYSTIISTSQTITAGAADLLTGSIAIVDAGAVGSDTFSPDVSDDLVISLNGTTTGGVAVGSWCRLTAISATRWFVEGVFNGSGTLATPFS
jgi:hypothetical protein